MRASEVPIISVVGVGYVGLTTAALLAEAGYKVYAIDLNAKRLETVRAGRSFFYEAGLDEIIAPNVKSGALIPTDSYQESIPQSDFVFSCVGTPDNPDGSSNLSYVFSAAEQAAGLMKPGAIYIQKSTVPVGTGAKIKKLFLDMGRKTPYVSNPEFLREGTAIEDTLSADRVVVGGDSRKAAEKVADLYRDIESQSQTIAAKAELTLPDIPATRYFVTGLESAEMIKVTANAFLALKISFANSIAKLADKADADINEVMNGVGADRRIGRAFLNAGRGYGGGCFPKDVSGLISSAADYGVDLAIMTAAADVNESMPGYIAKKAQEALGDLSGKKLTVAGLAFKAGTSDTRRSPGVKLANLLSHAGASVTAYDPKANGEAKEDLRKDVELCDSLEQAAKGAEALFISTDWPELISIEPAKLKRLLRGDLLVDCMNVFDPAEISKADLRYIGVGRGR